MVHWNVSARLRAIGITLVMVGATLGGSPAEVFAQATPAAAELDIPAPRECDAAPRDAEFFPAAAEPPPVATPAPIVTDASPFAMPEGEPADAETMAAVTATVREAIACRNANDFLRAYALFTDEMMGSLFGGPATIDPEIRAAIAEPEGPLPRQQRVALVAITEVTQLPDGRVGAIVETINAQRAFRDYLILEQDPASGRWLIDHSRVIGS